MKICSMCGTPNADEAGQCVQCGNVLPVTIKKKSGFKINGKAMLLSAAAAVVTGVIAAGVVFFGGGTAKAVGQAISKNEEAIVEEVSSLPNLTGYLDNFERLNDKGNYTMTANIKTDVLDFSGFMDYCRDDRLLAGTLTYANTDQDLDLKFDFSSDNKNFMIAADRLTADIYGFKLKEFAEKFDSTPVAALLPITDVGEDPDMDFFKKTDPAKSMEEKYGKVWKEFKKSVSYDEINERQMQIGSKLVMCRAYEIKWDTAAATRLFNAVIGAEENFLMNMTSIIKQLEPDCRVYVDEAGYIVALDFVAGGNKCTMTFEGEDNIWDECKIRSVSQSGGEGDIWGELSIQNGVAHGALEWDGVMEFGFDYSDITGEFEIEADLLGTQWYINGKLTSDNAGAQLSFGGNLPEHGDVRFSLEQNPLSGEPTMMGDKYVDLMGMDMRNWQRLLIDINNAG